MSASSKPTRRPAGPRQGEIGGRRGFADPALAGGDGDDILDAGERLEGALHGMRGDVGTQQKLQLEVAEQRLQGLLQLLPVIGNQGSQT
jgi:hypothetical protein